jgi:hypothetical protein
MIRKLFIFMLVCLIGVLPALAQDQESAAYAPCTEEELTATVEGISAYNEALAELGDIGAGPQDAAYGTILAAYDSFSYEYWYTLFPEIPACAEAQAFALNIGMIYDEYLTIGLLQNIAAWADASGDADTASLFTASVEARAAMMSETTNLMEGVTAEDMADWINSAGMESCDEETFTASLTGIGEYFTSLGEIQSQAAETIDENVAALIVSDSAAQAYWSDVYPAVSGCYEADYYAWEAGRILDETTIITALAVNAELENEAGNTDVAEVMAASIEARAEGLAAYTEAVFGTTEE